MSRSTAPTLTRMVVAPGAIAVTSPALLTVAMASSSEVKVAVGPPAVGFPNASTVEAMIVRVPATRSAIDAGSTPIVAVGPGTAVPVNVTRASVVALTIAADNCWAPARVP